MIGLCFHESHIQRKIRIDIYSLYCRVKNVKSPLRGNQEEATSDPYRKQDEFPSGPVLALHQHYPEPSPR